MENDDFKIANGILEEDDVFVTVTMLRRKRIHFLVRARSIHLRSSLHEYQHGRGSIGQLKTRLKMN